MLAASVLLCRCYDGTWLAIHGDVRNSDTAEAPGYTQIRQAWSRKFTGNIAAAGLIAMRYHYAENNIEPLWKNTPWVVVRRVVRLSAATALEFT